MRSGSSHLPLVSQNPRTDKARLTLRVSWLAIVMGTGFATARATETTTYTYDALGRVVGVQSVGTVNNNRSATYCFDAAGNRFSVKADLSGVLAPCPAPPVPTPTPSPSPTPAPSPTPTPAPAPTISISDGGNTEGYSVTLNITLSAASASSVSVAYAAATGTAGLSDFTATSGTLTFAPGQTTQAVAVPTTDDSMEEGDENFVVNLSNSSGATIADGQGAGWIYDNDTEQCGNNGCN